MIANTLHYLLKQKRNIILLSILIAFFAICLNYSFLLFHVFIELFSVIIAFSLFTITWNSRHILDNQYLFFIGIVAFFIGVLDTFHIVTYQGMNIIESENFYANQFWIATRFLESLAILSGFIFLNKKLRLRADVLLTVLAIITGLIMLSILYWEVFPACFIKDIGQTNFKIYSEYVIIAIFFIAILFLVKNKASFETHVYKLLMASIIFAIITEFSFSLYVSNFSFMNQIGHFTKLFTFYFIYKANIETGFIRPTEIIFNNLKTSENKFRQQSLELIELNKKHLAINEELENKVKEVNALVESKDKFFGIIAHDLKQPFNTLLGFSNLLIHNAATYSPEKVQQFAQSMNISAAHGFKLLENLLEWARLQTGKIKPDPVKIKPSEIINEVRPLKEQIAKTKNIDLRINVDSDEIILADKEMLKTILRNLISNALKFTPQGGTVRVTTKNYENNVLFEISDTGVGIDKQHLDKLFDIGSNISTKGTAGEKGTGLGLTLCKEFVEKNNGKIWVESEVKKGSTFKFTIPVYST